MEPLSWYTFFVANSLKHTIQTPSNTQYKLPQAHNSISAYPTMAISGRIALVDYCQGRIYIILDSIHTSIQVIIKYLIIGVRRHVWYFPSLVGSGEYIQILV